ncbi:ATP-binding protein [Streptomyces sp. NPDC005474]|uniref:ATP-binding protein n=1 Tax=Streptomyces sp. NPDC005474 TaxID=3154878 RepID=UPI0034517098
MIPSSGIDVTSPLPQVWLPPTPRGARLARLLTAEQLRFWRVPLAPARQIVVELAANAVTHGRVPGRDLRLTMYVIADALRIEVTDTCGDSPPCPQPPSTDTESGRSLGVAPEPRPPRSGATSGLSKET